MTDPSLSRNKRKITITASQKGVELADNALIRLGFDSKTNFAKSQFLSRSTVTKFFQREPIQLDSFKRICEALKLNWRETAGLLEQKQSEQLEINDCSSSYIDEEVEQLQTLHRKVTVIDKKSKTIKAVLILKGDINLVQNWKIIQSVIQEYSGDTIEITDIQEGSIRLFVEGSPEDIKRLISRIKSGELKEVSGFPVEDVQILSESSDGGESNKLNDKWYLVEEIVTHGARGRNLSGADLSDADLSSVNLSSADLSSADLSSADLSGANLSGADLSLVFLHGTVIDEATIISDKWRLVWKIVNQPSKGRDLCLADLSGANLSSANLSSTNLSLANLSSTNLTSANLSGANISSANLSLADLSLANLSSAYFSGANLSGANLSLANLSSAYFSSADLIGANLTSANLSGANLSLADLSLAFLHGTVIDEATIISDKWRFVWEIVNQQSKDRDLSLANLSGANLSGADLSGANLSGANLNRAKLSRANLSDANLSDANLSHANLSGANLSGANLSGADLSLADLSLADLSLADLSLAIVENARFGENLGLTEDMKRDLKRRGAIFEDSPGDRSGVLTSR